MLMNHGITGDAHASRCQMRTIIIQKAQRASIACAAAVLLAVQATAVGATHEYTVAVDAELRSMQVIATFDAPVTRVTAGSGEAAQFLAGAEDCGRNQPVATSRRGLHIPRGGITCLSYAVDLNKAAAADERNRSLDASNIIVSPGAWMWRPRLRGGDEIRVQFKLPDAVQVSVPWPRSGAENSAFRLAASPRSGPGIVVFGAFESVVADVAGTELKIDLLRSGATYDTATVVEWIRDSADNVAMTYGRFPNPQARVVVIPVADFQWANDSPVYFGRVVRDGGETVELFFDPRHPIEELYDDWTATHELSHLMLPYVERSHRWISEGFAQYYQNVLLARAGRYTQLVAWQKIADGLERGRLSVPERSPNQAAAVRDRDSRMKIYWSGAALALMADTELRKRSNGAESLDSVLDQLQRCCLPSQRAWSGTELFKKLDSFVTEPLFMDLYRLYANEEGFPDARPLLEQLGVNIDEGAVRLLDDAELAKIRASITARRYTGEPGAKRYSENGG